MCVQIKIQIFQNQGNYIRLASDDTFFKEKKAAVTKNIPAAF